MRGSCKSSASHWEAAQAVLVHGGDLGGCLNHLLVLHECSCRPSALSASTPSPFVDISLELQALSEIMSAGSLPQDLLEHALVLASGDISHALHLIISHPHGLPSSPSTQPFPFYSSPLSSSTTTTTTTAATAATATTTTSSSPHSSLPPLTPSFPTTAYLSILLPSLLVPLTQYLHIFPALPLPPLPSPPSPLPDYTIASPASFSHTPSPHSLPPPPPPPPSTIHLSSLVFGPAHRRISRLLPMPAPYLLLGSARALMPPQLRLETAPASVLLRLPRTSPRAVGGISTVCPS
ncbi:hypothetical protein CLOM_g4178 [Closterium sp. NIES-68]|nr:hypothetical protein CLOM_g4178 [Closterium sp. NIES-68]